MNIEHGSIGTVARSSANSGGIYAVLCFKCNNGYKIFSPYRNSVPALLREKGWATRKGKWYCKSCSFATM